MTEEAIIAVATHHEAEALRGLVKPGVVVVPTGAMHMGLRAKLVVVTFVAESVSGKSDARRQQVQEWIDQLQLRLVPGGRMVYGGWSSGP